MPGPPRTPTATLRVNGSRLAKARAAAEPPAVPGLPAVPPYLDAGARAVWAVVAPLLLARRVLTVGDGAVLGEHSQAVADVARLTRELAKAGELVTTPNGFLQRHPYTVLLREARVRVLKTAGLLGLSPADRSRAAAATEQPPSPDPMDAPPREPRAPRKAGQSSRSTTEDLAIQ